MLPIPTLLRETTRMHHERAAIITEDGQLTYEELDARVDRVASSLVSLGVTPGARVAVMATDSIQHIELTYAILRAGGVYVPLNYRLQKDEVRYLLNDSEPVVFAFDPAYGPIARDVRANAPGITHLIDLGHDPGGDDDTNDDAKHMVSYHQLLDGGDAAWPGVTIGLDDVMQIQYSSGTTGMPKGAVLTHRIVADRCALGLIESPRSGDDVSFSSAPFFHVAGSQLDYMVHIRGGTVVRHRQFDPSKALDALVRHRVTIAFFVPSMINFMLEIPGVDDLDFGALRRIEYGAAPMPQGLLRKAMTTFGCDFAQLFGAGTEGGLQSILDPSEHRLDDNEHSVRRLRSIGRPPVFTEVRVVRDDGSEVKPGEVGEIISRGASVMREYWRKPDATAETLRDGWLHAGDMGTVDEEGYLYLVDRKKDMIIRGGENIYPAEVELVLSEHPGLLEVTVIGVPDDVWGESVKAVVVARDGVDVTASDVIEFCRSRLASFKKPTSVDFVEQLPRNASGKVLKRQLRLPSWGGDRAV